MDSHFGEDAQGYGCESGFRIPNPDLIQISDYVENYIDSNFFMEYRNPPYYVPDTKPLKRSKNAFFMRFF